MFQPPDYNYNISMKLSEVLDDIGVNEKMVMRRRRTSLLQETMAIVTDRSTGIQGTLYYLGSMSEGTTTVGLRSDVDQLYSQDYITVIQDWSEWTPGKINFMMIQNEKSPPGYCLLQRLKDDAPLPATHEMGNVFVKDISGRIICKNTILDPFIPEGRQRQGPSIALMQKAGFADSDMIIAYSCKTWPESSKHWLDQQEQNAWPTKEMKRHIKTTRCFVVGVGSKASENADFKWRISTSLAKRCLMFSLNVTQIRCYVLMKMILKTYINLDNESYISSFMCKMVLFHCIANKPSNLWKECNLLKCLSLCLLTLNRCISSGNCPHFIDHENNLMAGKIPMEVKQLLLERMSNLTPCDVMSLFGIQIDDLGERLQNKLNMINEVNHNIKQPDEYAMNITSSLLPYTAQIISECNELFNVRTQDESFEIKLETLLQTILRLKRIYRDGDMIEKTSCKLIAPILCTTIGSLLASHNIQINNSVSPQALAWLEAGQNSDVASSKLKLASVMYCTGDMERAVFILQNIEEHYVIQVTESACRCGDFPTPYLKTGFRQLSSICEVVEVSNAVAFCVCFQPYEIYFVPHELQYEMFRSTQEDLLHRSIYDYWMDWAVVDSLPFLYFLQYKTYRKLQRHDEQQRALFNFVLCTGRELNLAHRETALNLLGQCMEQDNRLADALQCYIISLQQRERNNAARFHISRCFSKMQ